MRQAYSRFLTCILFLALFAGIWAVAMSYREQREQMHQTFNGWAQENGVTYSDPLTTP